ncbi:ADP-ribosylglycohydrolase family protein, partial [Streptomyces sp. NPDC005180]|uniref:ADP-ribosylglycohydrolase family protein n=1 Tax=Streptomyces sp. NPDC005180 TaxID=3156868 RepID=UPI0033BEAD3F
MNSEWEAAPRFVERRTNLRFEQDLQFKILPGGPERYNRRSSGPVQYVSVADAQDTVIGYLWASDDADAANWIVRKDGGYPAVNEGSGWVQRLFGGKERGIAPSELLAELIRESPFTTSHVVPGSLAEAPNSETLRALAGWPAEGTVKDAARGVLFGLALGDAMGYPMEFLTVEQIKARFGPWSKMEMPLSPGDVVRVTDDTQMALAVGEALAEAIAQSAEPQEAPEAPPGTRVRAPRPVQRATSSLTPAAVEAALRKHFVAWLHDPDNNRAPGQTCLNACAALERGIPWQDATVINSKGCGANMRVAPVALVPGLTPEQRSGIAQLQAALTHGHPTALAASDLTAHAIWLLAHGCALDDLIPRLRAYALESRQTYHADWLGNLADKAGAPDPATFIAFGWDECIRALDKASEALREPDMGRDPCEAVGP